MFPPHHNFGEVKKTKVLLRRSATFMHSRNGLHYEVDNGNIKIKFPHFHNSGDIVKKTKCLLRRPITILRSRNGLQCKLKSSLPCLKCSKEESNEFTKNHSRKLLEDKKLLCYHDSVVTALVQELLLAQRSINKLKAAQKSYKKKVRQFSQNLEDEKSHWKQREYKKIQANLCNLKDKLSREKRSRDRMKLLNTKLINELVEANLYAKQYMTNYAKEKKEREISEKVCNQLAMQIAEDKVKIEELLNMSMKLCEEVEEERKMMQMVDLWREECTQMRLVDAKLVLEDKYNQMVQLICYLKMFLRSKGAELGTIFESVNIQQISELSHYFSKFEEIFPIYEYLRKNNAGPLSTIHIVSLNEEELNKKTALHESSPSDDYNTVTEPTSSSECSVKSGPKSLKIRSKWRASPDSKLLRPCPNVGASSSSVKAYQHRRQGKGKGSVEGSFRHKELLGQGSSRDTMNPHITRGIKGCIEWPRGIPKANSKVIPLEEIVLSQKSQLQNILKHKAQGHV